MNTIPIPDLAYELRMLLGAAKQCQLFEEFDIGNPINYMKDSVYAHTRNLYNFFSANARNDAKVTQFTQHAFDLTFYRTWKSALHDHALHVKTSRHTPSNIVGGQHLNEQIQNFANDIEGLWEEWSNNTSDLQLKTELEEALNDARTQANDDYLSLKERLVNRDED
ncbi:MAG TPA: hypothetical protein VLG11_01415 [Candidatus Saccharimonadales bacterium]|nr:hypothetical protein [Candidatus Saccharimonadales bacterium]